MPKEPIDISLREKPNPVWGWCAVGTGLVAVVAPMGWTLLPVALACSIVALFRGEISWGIIGLMLVVAAILTSPMLLSLIGLGVFAAWIKSLGIMM